MTEQEAQRIALRIIHGALKDVDVSKHVNWPHLATLMPHAIALLGTTKDSTHTMEIGGICALLGIYFEVRGDYRKAEPYAERALGVAETVSMVSGGGEARSRPESPLLGGWSQKLVSLHWLRFPGRGPSRPRPLTS